MKQLLARLPWLLAAIGAAGVVFAVYEAITWPDVARLARLEQAQGNLDEAIWACERGLMASPTDETLIILLTETYLAQGKRGLANRLVDNWEDKISRLDCGEPSDAPRRRLVGQG